MTITAKAADGTIHTFPDDTPDDVVNKAMVDYTKTIFPSGGYYETPQHVADTPAAEPANSYAGLAKETFDKQTPGWLEPIRQAGNNMTLGLGDAFPAAEFAAGQAFTGGDFGKAYSAARDAQNTQTKERASPLNTAAGVAGGLAVPLPMGRILEGGGLLARVLKGVGTGTAVGATSGALNAPSLEAIPQGAAVGGTVGAAAGGGLPILAKGTSNVLRAANAATGGKVLPATGLAVQRALEALERDRATPQALLAKAAEHAAAGGPQPALADLGGENFRALLRAAASKPGEGRNRAVSYAEKVRESAPGDAIARARTLTPDTRPAAAVVDDLTAQRASAAKTDYGPAYASDVPVDEAAEAALQGAPGQAAIRSARADAVERMEPTGDFDRLLAGDFSNPVSGASMDRIRIAMGERAGKLARAGNNSRASGAMTRRDLIDNTLDNAPGLTEARAAYKDTSGAIDAVPQGATILKSTPDEFEAAAKAMTPQQLAAAKVGARQALTDALGQGPNAMPTLRSVAFAENVQRNLRSLFGDHEADLYVRHAQHMVERSKNADFISPNVGSQTQPRGSDAAEMVGSVVNAIRRPISTAASVLVGGGATMTEKERELLLRLGLGGLSDAQPVLAARPRGTSNAISARAALALSALPGQVLSGR